MNATATFRAEVTVGRLVRREAIRALRGFAWKHRLTCEIEQVDGLLESDLYVKMKGNVGGCRNAQRDFNSFMKERLS